MSVRIEGFEELSDRLSQLSRDAESIDGENTVPMTERNLGNYVPDLTTAILMSADNLHYSALSSSRNVARTDSGRGGRGAVSCRSIFSGFRVFW